MLSMQEAGAAISKSGAQPLAGWRSPNSTCMCVCVYIYINVCTYVCMCLYAYVLSWLVCFYFGGFSVFL